MKLYFLVSLDAYIGNFVTFSKCFVCVSSVFHLIVTHYMNLNTEPSKELRSMLRHLLEMMPASNVSGPGRDSAINLLVKQVPRKSLKNPDNSLALWVVDQGMKHILHVGKYFIKPWWIPRHALP